MATTVSARAALSTGPKLVGAGALRSCRASQLRVKLGTIRPPTSAISTTVTPNPRRQPMPQGSATPAASRCIRRFPTPSSRTAPAIGRLRQLRPARISRRTTTKKIAGKARSTAAAGQAPIQTDPAIAARPASQSSIRPASGAPCNGIRPVQFGIAVSRKPATTAPTKP